MKPLVLCYSLTGNTKKICGSLAKALGADFIEIYEITRRTKLSAYTWGCWKAMQHKSSDIRPVHKDIAAYDCLVIATPVWAGHITPAINDFIREYELIGKTVYGIVVYAADPKKASKELEQEIENAGAVCPNILAVKGSKEQIYDLKSGRQKFAFNEQGKLTIKKGNEE